MCDGMDVHGLMHWTFVGKFEVRCTCGYHPCQNLNPLEVHLLEFACVISPRDHNPAAISACCGATSLAEGSTRVSFLDRQALLVSVSKYLPQAPHLQACSPGTCRRVQLGYIGTGLSSKDAFYMLGIETPAAD